MAGASADATETAVLIVGAGPVGLALAADLGWRGVRAIVIEQSDGTIYHPRATAINARSMEFMRRWGVAEAVRGAAAPEGFPHTALYVTTLAGYELARIERPHHGGSQPTTTSPERAQRCNQLWLDPILLERARSFPPITVQYRTRLLSVVEEAGRVVATVQDLASGERREITASYLADCSGGHSAIREQLGIAMSGEAYAEYNLSVFVRAPALWTHHDKGAAALIFFLDETGIWRNLVLLDGRELYRFAVRRKEYYDAPDEAPVERLFNEAIGVAVPHEVISVRRWIGRDVVADRYGTARIFHVGDAAHLNNPSGGFGLNTGLGDAVDLGWKLAAMVAGWGGAGLPASYEIERRPVGLRNVHQASLSHVNDRDRVSHPAINAATQEGARTRSEIGADIVRGQTTQFITDGIALGYRYEGSPLVLGDGTPAPPDPVRDYTPTARPGARAPHHWLSAGRSVIDCFGRGFVLLRLGPGAADGAAIEHGFARRGVPLQTVTLPDPALAKLYERSLVLVRPDGHVAWRGDAPPSDPLALADRVRGAGAT
jgi:2-polyprenyl-6-methoxyphenol hydroxylase-like FAD-dependent oxidoreductase